MSGDVASGVAMRRPLSREERDDFWAGSRGTREEFLQVCGRYEATVQAAEAALREVTRAYFEVCGRYEAAVLRAEAALREIDMKPYRAEEVTRAYFEERDA